MFGDTTQAQPAAAQAQYIEESGIYAYQITLTALQALTDQSLIIDGNSDFILLGVYGTQTGGYNLRIRNGNSRYVSSSLLQNANFVGTAQFPVPLPKPFLVPSSGRIGIDIVDTSNGQNKIELCFVGLRRYKAA